MEIKTKFDKTESRISNEDWFDSKNLENKYLMEIGSLRQYIFVQEKDLQSSKREVQHFKELIQQRDMQIKKLNETINKKNQVINIQKNSIRYRIGSCFVNATKSLSGLIMLPINMIKLFIEYRKSK